MSSITWRGQGGTGRFLRGRCAPEARRTVEEGGTWGKHGFPCGSEPEASDVVEAYLGKQAVEGGGGES